VKLIFNEQEDDWWTCTEYFVRERNETIRLTFTSDEKPSESFINKALEKLKEIDQLALQAATEILGNYSYEHYKSLGVPEEKLEKNETPEAISNRAVLVSAWFMSEDCDEFELSFELPWDDYHSYDVEFENNKPLCCAVNG
jgi:hypothetical protein